MEDLFRVSAQSRPASLAGAIAGTIRDGKAVTLQAIGAGSVNQAVKAIVIARGFLANDGFEIICVPEFVEIDLDGNERTAVRFHIDQPGKPLPPATSIPAREVLVDAPPRGPASSLNGS
jgi:stage V sporulation protein S